MVIIVHFKAKPWLRCKLKRQQLCQCQNAFYTNVFRECFVTKRSKLNSSLCKSVH